MGECKINGYVVKHWYAGIDNYSVFKDGAELVTCWELNTVARTVMWRQR